MQVNAVIFFELFDEMVHDAQIKVIAAEEGITARRTDLEHTIAHIKNGNIERAAAKVINGNDFIFLFIKPIRQGGGRWLIDDAQSCPRLS